MTNDFMVVSRWRNRVAVTDLVERIRAAGRTVYSFFEGDGGSYALKDSEGALEPEAFMREFERTPDWWNDAGVREVFEIDLRALRAASTVILLLPAGKSAHIEAGVAYGLGKRLVLIGEQQEAESLYLIFDEQYPSIDDFAATLVKKTV